MIKLLPKSISPKKVMITPTFRCNFNCPLCGVEKTEDRSCISIRKVELFLEECRQRGYSLLFIAGGEPLLVFDDTVEIIRIAKKKGFYVILITNGYFIASNIEEAIDKLDDLDEIVYSVDSDHLLFISYEFILNAIKATLKSKIRVTIHMTTRPEIKEKNSKLLKRLLQDLDMKPLWISKPLGIRRLDDCAYDIFLATSKENVIMVSIGDFIKTRISPNEIISLFNPNFMDILFTAKCRGGIGIDQWGHVFPCVSVVSWYRADLYALRFEDTKENLFAIKNNLINHITQKWFPFVDIFLRIRRNKELLTYFLQRRYYSKCDFCEEIMKNAEKIKRIEPPSKMERTIFLISNLHRVLFSLFILFYFAVFQYWKNVIIRETILKIKNR